MTGSGDFTFGSAVWPGAAKLVEEMSELQVVLGKLINARGEDKSRWTNKNYRDMLVEEIADVRAALDFFTNSNMTLLEHGRIDLRHVIKFSTYKRWHQETLAGPLRGQGTIK